MEEIPLKKKTEEEVSIRQERSFSREISRKKNREKRGTFNIAIGSTFTSGEEAVCIFTYQIIQKTKVSKGVTMLLFRFSLKDPLSSQSNSNNISLSPSNNLSFHRSPINAKQGTHSKDQKLFIQGGDTFNS